ncbi:MAG: SH3 domain-containing protein [Anaerolineales bacterium]
MKTKSAIMIWLISMILISGCGGQGNTTYYAGPSINVADVVEVSLHLNSRGEFVVSGQVSIPLAEEGVLGDVSVDFGFETVLNQAASKSNYLIILWQDEDGNIRQNDYSVGQPFDITFEHDQWVQRIKNTENGNIIVYVQKQAIPVSAAPQADTSSQQTDSSSYWCDDLSGVHLAIGDGASIVWPKVNLRSSPEVPQDFYANIVTELEEGTYVTIVGGPECAHEGTWWEVRTENGDSGWVREFTSKGYLMQP